MGDASEAKKFYQVLDALNKILQSLGLKEWFVHARNKAHAMREGMRLF